MNIKIKYFQVRFVILHKITFEMATNWTVIEFNKVCDMGGSLIIFTFSWISAIVLIITR